MRPHRMGFWLEDSRRSDAHGLYKHVLDNPIYHTDFITIPLSIHHSIFYNVHPSMESRHLPV